jgi:CubicO group peptidase (beta-lactamase class C family)
MRFLALYVGLALVFLPHPGLAGPNTGLAERLEEYLAPYDDAGELSGTLLVARGDTVLFQHAYGYSNLEQEVPTTSETRFCIASLTKPMTIAVVCGLAEDGKLAPGDSLAKWIPDFPRGRDITVSILLNHRAGIPHRVTDPAEETVPHTAADMVAFAARKPLMFEPGEKSVYSSAGYSVLARVCELAGGKPYEELLEQYVFGPAGMTRSLHADSRMIVKGRASSYAHGPHGLVNATLRDMSFLVGAGSVCSTAMDIHRLIRALVDGKLGDAARIALLRDNSLNWSGISNGFRAFAEFDGETGLEVIYLGNVHTGAVDRLRADIPKLAAGEDVPSPVVPEPKLVDVDAEILTAYAGHYESERNGSTDIRAVPGGLYVGDWFLVPTSDSTFFSPQDYGTADGVRGPQGKIVELDWHYPGGVLKWQKADNTED